MQYIDKYQDNKNKYHVLCGGCPNKDGIIDRLVAEQEEINSDQNIFSLFKGCVSKKGEIEINNINCLGANLLHTESGTTNYKKIMEYIKQNEKRDRIILVDGMNIVRNRKFLMSTIPSISDEFLGKYVNAKSDFSNDILLLRNIFKEFNFFGRTNCVIVFYQSSVPKVETTTDMCYVGVNCIYGNSEKQCHQSPYKKNEVDDYCLKYIDMLCRSRFMNGELKYKYKVPYIFSGDRYNWFNSDEAYDIGDNKNTYIITNIKYFGNEIDFNMNASNYSQPDDVINLFVKQYPSQSKEKITKVDFTDILSMYVFFLALVVDKKYIFANVSGFFEKLYELTKDTMKGTNIVDNYIEKIRKDTQHDEKENNRLFRLISDFTLMRIKIHNTSGKDIMIDNIRKSENDILIAKIKILEYKIRSSDESIKKNESDVLKLQTMLQEKMIKTHDKTIIENDLLFLKYKYENLKKESVFFTRNKNKLEVKLDKITKKYVMEDKNNTDVINTFVASLDRKEQLIFLKELINNWVFHQSNKF